MAIESLSVKPTQIINRPSQVIDDYKPRIRWYQHDIFTDPQALTCPATDLDHIREVLFFDMVSEYDARIFGRYLRGAGIKFTPSFMRREREWLKDEDNHFRGFRFVNLHALGRTPSELDVVYQREGNFDPIAYLLQDEFSIALLAAYDEIVTTNGYKRDIPVYDQFGPPMAKFIRRVIADEAQHYNKFTSVIRNVHPHRLHEVPDRMKEIRAIDGTVAYQNFFVLDHMEDIYTDDLLDQCAETVVKHLTRERQIKADERKESY